MISTRHCRGTKLIRLKNRFLTRRLIAALGKCSGTIALASAIVTGCGTTRGYDATEQLVVSDAVDESISQIDFRPLSGRRVYLDTSYLRHVKGAGFVNAEYVTSSLRQQIVGAGCLIQDTSKDAELIIEARLGTLGLDDHRVTFGIPENNGLASAAQLIPGSPSVPTVPEISFAKRESREAAAKVVAFAYDRETRAPIWQSGVGRSVATARDTWFMGIGPFQAGSVRKGTKLAGSKLRFGKRNEASSPARHFDRPPVDYTAETRFQDGWPLLDDGGVASEMIGTPESAFEKEQRAIARGKTNSAQPIETDLEMIGESGPGDSDAIAPVNFEE